MKTISITPQKAGWIARQYAWKGFIKRQKGDFDLLLPAGSKLARRAGTYWIYGYAYDGRDVDCYI